MAPNDTIRDQMPRGGDELISALTADLTPVRRAPRPTVSMLAWVAFVLVLAIGLAVTCNLSAVVQRLTGAPDLSLAALGSTLTAVLAALAAFELSLPDRARAWALLPLPALALWLVASGGGCLRAWLVPGTTAATLNNTEDCLSFILGLSIPLAALLILLLRRGYSLYPRMTAALGGLACAAAAATLLNFVHPYDATALDLVVHAIAVTAVVMIAGLAGGRALAPKPRM